MKMFNKILMGSEFDVNKLKTGYFFDANGALADVEDGAFVSIGDLMDHDLYDNTKDFNARKITAYSAGDPIYGFVDYVGVSHADVMGVNYRIGDKIAGTFPPAGESTRVRMLDLGDEFYLGNENFDEEPTVGEYATVPAAGETVLAVSATPVTGKFCVKIEDDRDLVMGQVNVNTRFKNNDLVNDKLYRCRVISL